MQVLFEKQVQELEFHTVAIELVVKSPQPQFKTSKREGNFHFVLEKIAKAKKK